MRKHHHYALLFLLLLLLVNCEDWNYKDVNVYPTLLTEVISTDPDSLIIETSLINFGDLEIITYGHCVTTNSIDSISLENCSANAGVNFNELQFSEVVKLEEINQLYFIRAYVTINLDGIERTIFGLPRTFATDDFTLTTSDYVGVIDPNTASIQGFVEGLDANLIIKEHGHIWSTSAEINDISDGNITSLGTLVADGAFRSTLSNLKSQTTYYTRSYAMVNDVIYLSENTTSFQLGGWQSKITTTKSPPPRALSTSFIAHNQLFIGGGFFYNGQISDLIEGSDLAAVVSNLRFLEDLWAYNLESGEWTQKKDIPNSGTGRIAPTSFVIGNHAYVGWGLGIDIISLFINPDETTVPRKDFYRYDILNDTWEELAIPENIQGRYGPMVFVEGDSIAYIGVGSTRTTGLKDFYKFSPKDNSWERKADFPGGTQRLPASFSIDGKGFFVTGDARVESQILFNFEASNAFWTYDSRMDRWKQLADFPGGKRNFSQGWSIDGKGYVALGIEEIELPYADLWEYDPQFDVWIKLEDFPDGFRAFNYGASNGRRAFLGGGVGVDSNTVLNWDSDIWEYLNMN